MSALFILPLNVEDFRAFRKNSKTVPAALMNVTKPQSKLCAANVFCGSTTRGITPNLLPRQTNQFWIILLEQF